MAGLLRRVEEIAREVHARRVVRVRVAIGALAHISPDHFREHFVTAAQGTAAEGAALEIRVVEGIDDPRAQEIVLESADIEEP
jgi:hydrogenase nickel incorporation protein HypA/HybF